jgi:hypothetical protein
MTPVTIDADLLTKLTSNGGKVPLADAAGATVGYFVSSDRLAMLEQAFEAQLDEEPTEEDVRRILADPRWHTTEEVFKLLEGE